MAGLRRALFVGLSYSRAPAESTTSRTNRAAFVPLAAGQSRRPRQQLAAPVAEGLPDHGRHRLPNAASAYSPPSP